MPIDQVHQVAFKRRYGDHEFGVFLAQDIKFAASLLTYIATHIEGKCLFF